MLPHPLSRYWLHYYKKYAADSNQWILGEAYNYSQIRAWEGSLRLISGAYSQVRYGLHCGSELKLFKGSAAVGIKTYIF